LRSIGLQPDVLVCRSDRLIPKSSRNKIALFTNVEERAVISLQDAPTIYQVPAMLHEQKLDDLVVEKFGLDCSEADLTEWHRVVDAQLHPERRVRIAIVGKYLDLLDAYKSLSEAVVHAGIQTRTKVDIRYVDAEDIETNGTATLQDVQAILVPGGFGQRGFEGKIKAAQFARENGVPYLGICYGLHAAVIDFARNVAGLEDAHSTEINPNSPHPVIAMITEWLDRDGSRALRSADSDLGGTMRLGEQACWLTNGSLSRAIYGEDVVYERHRHRYEVNERYLELLQNDGLKVAGRSEDGLVEMIELAEHPWFVACQFHPEFTSSPRDGHPLFRGFIEAALAYSTVEASLSESAKAIATT